MLQVVYEIIDSSVKRAEAIAELKKINVASIHKSVDEGLKLVSQAVNQRYFSYDTQPNFDIKWGAYMEDEKLYELKERPKKVEEPPKPVEVVKEVVEVKKKRGRRKVDNPNVLEEFKRRDSKVSSVSSR